jgi:beta-1,4-mannosyl-glycoprotein beta-1,4-N-acetylglucosaminyltransferase
MIRERGHAVELSSASVPTSPSPSMKSKKFSSPSRMRISCLSPRRFMTIVFVFSMLFYLVLNVFFYGSVNRFVHVVTYATRPLWDKADAPHFKTVIPRYSHPNLTVEQTCSLHGFQAKGADSPKRKIYDAIMLSIELDLLEIRLHELWDVVDVFMIFESPKTFTGKAKPMMFEHFRERFKWAESRIEYIPDDPNRTAKERVDQAWDNEWAIRDYFENHIRNKQELDGNYLILCDLDEIPVRESVMLFKTCDIPHETVHFQMRKYTYSFEFEVPIFWYDSRIVLWKHGHSSTRRGIGSDITLADSGWHCSFCFKYVEDFTFKMTAFSHADRVWSPHLLEHERVQDKICKGEEIFEYLPEVYTWKDMVVLWSGFPKTTSMVRLPFHVVNNSDQYGFLLPGGCRREYRSKYIHWEDF